MEVEKLQRYDLVERIAAGGMGEVFRARATGPHGFEKTLAVKRILPELSSDPEFVERFVHESKLAVSLSHANIVQVFDLGRAGEDLFLVMEYVHGTDLSRLLLSTRAAGRQIPIALALLIVAEAAQGLAYAHGREDLDERSGRLPGEHGVGVIHCDISPSNLLLSYAGEVKLTDFGVAQLVDHTRRTTTQAQNVMGKWRYMAPEQIRGEAVDARTDLYALGVVLYEMLAGRKAFSGDGVKATCDQVLAGQAQPVRVHRPEVSAELEEFIAQVMSVNPRQRPVDARAFLNQILSHQRAHDEGLTALDLGALVRELVPPPPDVPRRAGLSALFQPMVVERTGDRGSSVVRRKKPAASFLARADSTGSEAVTQWVQTGVSVSSWEPKKERPLSRQLALLGLLLVGFMGVGLAAGLMVSRALPAAPAPQRGEALSVQPAPPVGPGQHGGVAPEPIEPIPQELAPLLRPADKVAAPRGAPGAGAEQRSTGGRGSGGPERKEAQGFLDIYVEPWANVTLDGRLLDQPTPLRQVPVRAGAHELVLTNPVLPARRTVHVRVAQGETQKVEIYLVNK